jgi:hypothetical protein
MMIEPLYLVALWLTLGAGAFLVFLGLIGRAPSMISLGIAASVELLLVVQLAVSLGVVIGGQRAQVSTWEYFGYLLVALLVPAGGMVWALVERSRWSTLVLGASVLTVSVMLVRMWSIWSGTTIS